MTVPLIFTVVFNVLDIPGKSAVTFFASVVADVDDF